MFHLKSLKILNLEPMLEEIANAVHDRFDMTVVTSAFRPGDEGVHGTIPVRGLDLRCRDKMIGNIICNWVNARWQYDPKRPFMDCAMCHDVGSGIHLHFQVHPNTIRRG